MAMTQGQCRGFFWFFFSFFLSFFFFWFFLMRLSLSSFLPVVLCLSIERGPLDFALAPSVSVPCSGDCYIACALQRHVCEAGALGVLVQDISPCLGPWPPFLFWLWETLCSRYQTEQNAQQNGGKHCRDNVYTRHKDQPALA